MYPTGYYIIEDNLLYIEDNAELKRLILNDDSDLETNDTPVDVIGLEDDSSSTTTLTSSPVVPKR